MAHTARGYAGYAIPVISTVKNQTDLVVAGSGKLIGYDPETGRERWTCNSLLRTVMTSPVVVGDTIIWRCKATVTGSAR